MLGIIDQWIMYYVNSATKILYIENNEGVRINIRTLYAVLYEFCNGFRLDYNTADSTMAYQYQFSACTIRELLGLYQKDIITAIDGVIATAINMILFNQKPDSERIETAGFDCEEEEDENIITIEPEEE